MRVQLLCQDMRDGSSVSAPDGAHELQMPVYRKVTLANLGDAPDAPGAQTETWQIYRRPETWVAISPQVEAKMRKHGLL